MIGSRIDLVSTRVSNETYRSADMQGQKDAPRLEIGLFINNLHGVDHSLGTFSADGEIWGKWDDASQARWKEINSGKEIGLDQPMSFDSAFIYSSNAISEGHQPFVKKAVIHSFILTVDFIRRGIFLRNLRCIKLTIGNFLLSRSTFPSRCVRSSRFRDLS